MSLPVAVSKGTDPMRVAAPGLLVRYAKVDQPLSGVSMEANSGEGPACRTLFERVACVALSPGPLVPVRPVPKTDPSGFEASVSVVTAFVLGQHIAENSGAVPQASFAATPPAKRMALRNKGVRDKYARLVWASGDRVDLELPYHELWPSTRF